VRLALPLLLLLLLLCQGLSYESPDFSGGEHQRGGCSLLVEGALGALLSVDVICGSAAALLLPLLLPLRVCWRLRRGLLPAHNALLHPLEHGCYVGLHVDLDMAQGVPQAPVIAAVPHACFEGVERSCSAVVAADCVVTKARVALSCHCLCPSIRLCMMVVPALSMAPLATVSCVLCLV
jgi:hypothetical protein